MVSKNVKTLALLGGGLYAATKLGDESGSGDPTDSSNIGIVPNSDGGGYTMEAAFPYNDSVEWTLTNQETNETLSFSGNPVTDAQIPAGRWSVTASYEGASYSTSLRVGE